MRSLVRAKYFLSRNGKKKTVSAQCEDLKDLQRPSSDYPFPKPLLSIKFDIFDIIFDTSGLSHRRSLSRSRKAPQYCSMRVGTHVHAGACVRHRMWSTCCAPARAAHGPSVHIKHTYGRPPSSTRRRQPARGTCRLASSSACHAYSSPSPSS